MSAPKKKVRKKARKKMGQYMPCSVVRRVSWAPGYWGCPSDKVTRMKKQLESAGLEVTMGVPDSKTRVFTMVTPSKVSIEIGATYEGATTGSWWILRMTRHDERVDDITYKLLCMYMRFVLEDIGAVSIGGPSINVLKDAEHTERLKLALGMMHTNMDKFDELLAEYKRKSTTAPQTTGINAPPAMSADSSSSSSHPDEANVSNAESHSPWQPLLDSMGARLREQYDITPYGNRWSLVMPGTDTEISRIRLFDNNHETTIMNPSKSPWSAQQVLLSLYVISKLFSENATDRVRMNGFIFTNDSRDDISKLFDEHYQLLQTSAEGGRRRRRKPGRTPRRFKRRVSRRRR